MEISEDNEQRAAAILHQVQHDLGATVFFEKPLTASDASGSGRVVIPKVKACLCMLPRVMPRLMPVLNCCFMHWVIVPIWQLLFLIKGACDQLVQSWLHGRLRMVKPCSAPAPTAQAIAEQYFPRLEQPSGLPVRAVDTRGHEYTFKFRCTPQEHFRMHACMHAAPERQPVTLNMVHIS